MLSNSKLQVTQAVQKHACWSSARVGVDLWRRPSLPYPPPQSTSAHPPCQVHGHRSRNCDLIYAFCYSNWHYFAPPAGKIFQPGRSGTSKVRRESSEDNKVLRNAVLHIGSKTWRHFYQTWAWSLSTHVTNWLCRSCCLAKISKNENKENRNYTIIPSQLISNWFCDTAFIEKSYLWQLLLFLKINLWIF